MKKPKQFHVYTVDPEDRFLLVRYTADKVSSKLDEAVLTGKVRKSMKSLFGAMQGVVALDVVAHDKGEQAKNKRKKKKKKKKVFSPFLSLST